MLYIVLKFCNGDVQTSVKLSFKVIGEIYRINQILRIQPVPKCMAYDPILH